MSRRLEQRSGRDVAAIFVRLGFEVAGTRGSHSKLRRTLPTGERQTLTIPLHATLATGTLHAIHRQASRFIAPGELDPLFYTEDPRQPHDREARSSPRDTKPKQR